MSADPSPGLPTFEELPEDRGARSAWDLFGPGDRLGRLNLITPERTAAAAGLAHRGDVFRLDLPVDFFPVIVHRTAPRRRVDILEPPRYRGMMIALDDALDDFNTQCSTHWDSLAHVSADPETFFGGVSLEEVEAGKGGTIERWRRGIVGRGVLLDVPRARREAGLEWDASAAPAVSVEDLERARELGSIELRAGDVMLVNTGFLEWVGELGDEERDAVMTAAPPAFVGLDQGEAMVRWLWESGVAAIAADAPGLERYPNDPSGHYGSLHRILIGLLGFPLGEFFDLRALAADCAGDGVYEFLFTSSPLNLRLGVASPANALAVK
jgi:hypothetical protein